MALRHWLALSLTDGIGPILSRRLIEAAGGVEAACVASPRLLQQVDGVGTKKAGAIARNLPKGMETADQMLARAATAAVDLICPDDAAYPLLLKNIPDPPLVLYARGTLEPRDLNAVAIVGSRKCSFYGREQAERFGALLAGAGVTVISGGARGIDSAAHRGAMSHPLGRTIAVLGSGVDVPYPPENAPLFEQIAAGRGVVLSEFPLGTPPAAENFPRRNRIVSGMSRGVLVIEADVRSGALITARQAADDHDRPVFALPGRVDNALSAGPHHLIRDGATLVTGLEEILGELGPLPQQAIEPSVAVSDPAPARPAPAAEPASLSPAQQAIWSVLGSDPMGVDEIADRSDLDVATVLREVTLLSLKAVIRRSDGQRFSRAR